MIIDIILVNMALYVALILRFDWEIPQHFLTSFHDFALVFTAVQIGCFQIFGLYKRLWQYASVGELLAVFYSVSAGTVINICLAYFSMNGA